MRSSVLNRTVLCSSPTHDFDKVSLRAFAKIRQCEVLCFSLCLLGVLFLCCPSLAAQSKAFRITQQYLNIPISRQAKSQIFTITENGAAKREIPLQLAEAAVDYWIYIDVSEFR